MVGGKIVKVSLCRRIGGNQSGMTTQLDGPPAAVLAEPLPTQPEARNDSLMVFVEEMYTPLTQARVHIYLRLRGLFHRTAPHKSKRAVTFYTTHLYQLPRHVKTTNTHTKGGIRTQDSRYAITNLTYTPGKVGSYVAKTDVFAF
ncbi:hypothetical protein Bbelb_009180 [Branchiostoma belcheri]|nr:hypothetical protein Bbelb_009180 [Branchiostoma belcheri]